MLCHRGRAGRTNPLENPMTFFPPLTFTQALACMYFMAFTVTGALSGAFAWEPFAACFALTYFNALEKVK